ncbi:MAG: RnfABCDGE type electron transport complex subunit D, partial [Porticoccaceae bacterium]
MAFKQITSPHAHAAQNTGKVMQLVLWATAPGLLALTYHFGWGSLINVLLATATAVIAEAAVIRLRGRSVSFYLRDYSAAVTAVLLGLALPPLAPWWIVVVGSLFSIVIAKHLYGGLGYNPFNPAMVGYVVLLISFPIQMTSWVTPLALLPEGLSHPGIIESINIVFLGYSPADGVTGATPLDSFKFSDGLLVDQIYAQNPLFSEAAIAGVGWEWVNIG